MLTLQFCSWNYRLEKFNVSFKGCRARLYGENLSREEGHINRALISSPDDVTGSWPFLQHRCPWYSHQVLFCFVLFWLQVIKVLELPRKHLKQPIIAEKRATWQVQKLTMLTNVCQECISNFCYLVTLPWSPEKCFWLLFVPRPLFSFPVNNHENTLFRSKFSCLKTRN